MESVNAMPLRLASGMSPQKRACRVVATTAITLSGLQTIDGVLLVEGERVLVNGQASAVANGIYIASTGAWVRAIDFSASIQITLGCTVPVVSGTAGALSLWMLSTPASGTVTLGTSSLNFTKLAQAA